MWFVFVSVCVCVCLGCIYLTSDNTNTRKCHGNAKRSILSFRHSECVFGEANGRKSRHSVNERNKRDIKSCRETKVKQKLTNNNERGKKRSE